MENVLLGKILSIMGLLPRFSLLVVIITALVTAVVCTRRKLWPHAAWLLFAGYMCSFLLSLATYLFYMKFPFFYKNLGAGACTLVEEAMKVLETIFVLIIVTAFWLFGRPRIGRPVR